MGLPRRCKKTSRHPGVRCLLCAAPFPRAETGGYCAEPIPRPAPRLQSLSSDP